MTATWMLYAAALATLLAAAAACAERALRAGGKAARRVWTLSLMLSLVAPLAALGVASRTPGPSTPTAATPSATSRDDGAGLLALLARVRIHDDLAPGVADRWRALDEPLLAGWLVASLAACAWLLLARRRLQAAARQWRPATIDGARVLVSADAGPAAVAGDGGRIVLPAWALTLDEPSRTLLLAHERAHLAARDPELLVAAAVGVAVAPWNPALWWQYRRVRLAVEIDCDRRVLRRHPDVAAYGALLLDVARRRGATRPTLAAAFSAPAPTTALERRIRSMTSRRPRHAALRALAFGALGTALVIVACEAPRPTALKPTSRVPLASITPAASASAAPNDSLGAITLDKLRAAVGGERGIAGLARDHVNRIWIVADVDGHVVARDYACCGTRDGLLSLQNGNVRLAQGRTGIIVDGAKTAAGPSLEIEPSKIQSMDVFKLAPGRLTPDSVVAVWITLRTPGVLTADDTALGPVKEATANAKSAEARFHVTVNPAGQVTGVGAALLRGGGHASATTDVPHSAFRTSDGAGGQASATKPAPLYVIDGVVTESRNGEPPIKSPDDIASVDVLKGPTAVARYGDAGANGVIIVTTKAHAAAAKRE